MSFRETVREFLNRFNRVDVKNLGVGDRLLRLERQVAWHGGDDSDNRNTIKFVGSLTQACAVLNDIKDKYTAHIAETAPIHKAADATNTISASAATDQSSAETLANELKEEINDHIALAASHDAGSTSGVGEAGAGLSPVDFVNYVTSADASSLATLLVLTDEIQKKYRAHTFRGPLMIEDTILMDPS